LRLAKTACWRSILRSVSRSSSRRRQHLNVDLIEVVGHTDEQPLVLRQSNLIAI
jgi:hypothetical protein